MLDTASTHLSAESMPIAVQAIVEDAQNCRPGLEPETGSSNGESPFTPVSCGPSHVGASWWWGSRSGPRFPTACFLSATGTGGAGCLRLPVWPLACSVLQQLLSRKLRLLLCRRLMPPRSTRSRRSCRQAHMPRLPCAAMPALGQRPGIFQVHPLSLLTAFLSHAVRCQLGCHQCQAAGSVAKGPAHLPQMADLLMPCAAV